MTGSDLDNFRHDLRASLRRAKTARRDLAGTPHEMRVQMLVESLERCIRDLTYLVLAADSERGLYSGPAVERHQSHGQRRSEG